MSLIASDKIWGTLFIVLGIAALGVVLINISGLSPFVSITCAFGGIVTIAFSLFCFSTR